MVKYLCNYVILIIVATLAACSNDSVRPAVVAAHFSQNEATSITISANTKGAFIAVKSNVEWNISVQDSEGQPVAWCVPEKNSAIGDMTLWLNVAPNKDDVARNVTITLSSTGEKTMLSLVQGAASAIDDGSLSTDFMDGALIEASQTSAQLTVNSASAWSLRLTYPGTVSGWCTPSVTSGTAGQSVVTITTGTNSTTDNRTMLAEVTSGGHTVSAMLTQSAKTDVTLSADFTTTPFVDASARSITLRVASNAAWTISTSYGGDTGWCSPSLTSGSSNRDVVVSIPANTSAVSRQATLSISAPPRIVTVTLTQSGTSAEPVTTGRYELPKIVDKTWFLEYTAGRFALEYDITKKHAKWVAWQLYASCTGSSGRTDAWQFDSRIPAQYSTTKADFDGYDRGHLCPSHNRTASTTMNRETFYYSNMSPQVSALNQGVWLQLENSVAEWGKVKNDTLYICAGGALDNDIIKYTSPSKMAVPKYYFKVVLRKKGDGTMSAIGFWFENKSYGGNTLAIFKANLPSIAKSVRDIEALTGLDFFYNLPRDVQDRVENQRNLSDWGLN